MLGSWERPAISQRTYLSPQRRTAMAIERRLKQAEFPMVKEMTSYRFADVPKLNKKYVLDLAQCQFIETRTNLVLTGPPGVGKTHLAIAFGREACKRGYKVKFFTASKLVNTYIEARQERMILKLEKNIRQCDLIIIDELGYRHGDHVRVVHCLVAYFDETRPDRHMVLLGQVHEGLR